MAEQLPAKTAPRARLPNLVEHLEPERLLKRHREGIGTWATRWMHADTLCHEVRRSLKGREEIRRDLVACPSLSALATIADELGTALALKPDRRVTQAAVAVLFDSRVRGPQNPEIYLEALTYDLADEGFPPSVVVAACQTLRRESVFTPEIAEVIAACRKKLETYQAVAKIAGRLFDVRERIEDALKMADAEPPPASPTPRPAPRADAQPGDRDWG